MESRHDIVDHIHSRDVQINIHKTAGNKDKHHHQIKERAYIKIAIDLKIVES